MKRLASYFLKGLLFIVPVVVTVYVFYLAFIKIDRLLRIPIPGVGFLATLALITLIGFFTSNIFTNSLLLLIDRLFKRLPLVKLLYASLKDLIGAFVGNKKSFNKPVVVTLVPGSNIQAVGFITRESLASWGLQDQVVVYLPQSYNFAGNLVIVPRAQVAPLAVDSAEVMAFIISGGVSG